VVELARATDRPPSEHVARVIARDGAEPVHEPIGVATILEPGGAPHERIVTDILGVGAVEHDGQGDGVCGVVVATNERVECRGVTPKSGGDQRGIGSSARG
jgi:hypothetical protein